MSEFHPLHVKSRNVRLRKIKTQWRTNTKIKRIRFICFTQTSSFAYHSTWPSTLLSVKTEELAIRQKAKFLPGYVRRIYFRDVLRFHIMLLYIYSSFLNVKFLHARSASVHATPYVLNTKLRDAYLNLSFLLQLITWSVPHFIAHLMYKENDLFFRRQIFSRRTSTPPDTISKLIAKLYKVQCYYLRTLHFQGKYRTFNIPAIAREV